MFWPHLVTALSRWRLYRLVEPFRGVVVHNTCNRVALLAKCSQHKRSQRVLDPPTRLAAMDHHHGKAWIRNASERRANGLRLFDEGAPTRIVVSDYC